ncbi:hypothetical protein KBD09_02935 [Candidatus Woesebacteria bacterium]|nr:hypothetical protein [Candidatus Woesebacteria bacterium]
MIKKQKTLFKVKRLPVSPEELRTTIEQQKNPTGDEPHPQEIFSWVAPVRPYKKQTAGILRFYLAVTLLMTLLVFFFGDRILILPIWSTLFVIYILTVTPPPVAENRITKFGIDIAGRTYRWEDLSHFYFVKRFDYDVLTIMSQQQNGAHLYIVVPDEKIKARLMQILGDHLVYLKEPVHTATDKMATWLTSLMPAEVESQADLSKTEA